MVTGYVFYPIKIESKLLNVMPDHITPMCVGNTSESSLASFGWVKAVDDEGWMIWRAAQWVTKPAKPALCDKPMCRLVLGGNVDFGFGYMLMLSYLLNCASSL